MKRTIFEIDPMGKPRMVRSDIWAGRRCVSDYYAFKDKLVYQARKKRYKIGNVLNIEFQIAMSSSWSDRKKKLQDGKPHLFKPDIDNLIKAFLDCLLDNDSKVWSVKAEKRWGRKGKIVVTS